MYSRYTSAPREKGYRIPEHYSGCAFASPQKEEARQESEPLPPSSLPKTKISPSYAEASSRSFVSQPTPAPAPHQNTCSPPPPAEPVPPPAECNKCNCGQEEPCKPQKEPVLPGTLGQLLSHIGGGLPFAHGIDFDSLLLLGLILLLAGDGGDTELLLLLTLLLFCS